MPRSDHSSRTHKDIPNSPTATNWVEEAGGLPKYIERVAKHIKADSGYSTSRAIAAAVSQTKKRAAQGNAAAIKAIAQWKAMKAKSKTTETASIHEQVIELEREAEEERPNRWTKFKQLLSGRV